jgi:flagellar motor switch protein FliM
MEPDRPLTQEEIDALLKAVPELTGEAPRPPKQDGNGRVRRYDFRTPDRFSKEQVRILQMVYSTFGRHFSGALSAALRTAVQVAFVHIEQSTFGDFSESLPEAAITAVVTMEPLPGRCLVQLELPVVLAAIDRLLGGRGKPVKAEGERELSDIEAKLIRHLLRHLENATREAWAALLDIRPAVTDISARSQVLQVALPTDAAVMVVFEVRMGEVAGMMTVCLPYELLKPVAPKLTPQAWITAGSVSPQEEVRELLEYHVERVPVSVRAVLGMATLRMRDLLSLSPGDVVVLDSLIGDEVEIYVEQERKYTGWPGLIRNRRAVKVARVLEADEWV